MQTEVTVAIIVSAFSLLGTLAVYMNSAKKNDVEALRGIIKELKDYITDLESDKEDLQAWAEKLVCQVKEAGMVPAKFCRNTQPRKP